jgi:hypothetical protein
LTQISWKSILFIIKKGRISVIKHSTLKACGYMIINLSELGEGEWSASHPVCFTPEGRAPTTHWIRAEMAPELVWTMCKRELYSPNQTPTHCHQPSQIHTFVEKTINHFQISLKNVTLHVHKQNASLKNQVQERFWVYYFNRKSRLGIIYARDYLGILFKT